MPPSKPFGPRPVSWARFCWQVASATFSKVNEHNISLISSGVGFYGMLALFPGMAALVSIYGLIADPTDVQRDLTMATGILPAEVLSLLDQQLTGLTVKPHSHLSTGLIISILFALWSARAGLSALMSALNIAYEETERRGIIMQYVIASAITVGAILFCFAALGLVAAVPIVIDYLPMSTAAHDWLELIRWPALAFLFLVALGFLYRFGPDRAQPQWELISPGAAVAMVLWLIASSGFALYVESFGAYDQTYGSLGAAVVLLMWFYLSAFAILVGAELNNVCDRKNRERSPAG